MVGWFRRPSGSECETSNRTDSSAAGSGTGSTRRAPDSHPLARGSGFPKDGISEKNIKSVLAKDSFLGSRRVFVYVGNDHPHLKGQEIDLAKPEFRKILGSKDLAVSRGEGRYRPAELGEVEKTLKEISTRYGGRKIRIVADGAGGLGVHVKSWHGFDYRGPFGKFFLTAALEQRGDVNRSYWPPRTSSRPSGRLEG